jgi:hypothetical protein
MTEATTIGKPIEGPGSVGACVVEDGDGFGAGSGAGGDGAGAGVVSGVAGVVGDGVGGSVGAGVVSGCGGHWQALPPPHSSQGKKPFGPPGHVCGTAWCGSQHGLTPAPDPAPHGLNGSPT